MQRDHREFSQGSASGHGDGLTMDDGAKVTLDGNLPDRAIFDPQDWQLTDFEADLCAETRRLAQSKFAARASIIDREARFPVSYTHLTLPTILRV